ncbi:hypothetical protein AVEN_264524-1 [Araneus ventricosus]|uniref:Uncharacterized protein n=1 Tax=Araneus ventricosus TaxID=182803 RepID=A0A4Y2G9I8_ARAVE|nr:hypothetical protein AVEN_264524-1 [Araneus ventricosus]
MLKIEGVKWIFGWFATPKIITGHNAEEKRKRHTPEHRGTVLACVITILEDPGQVSNSSFGTHSSNKSSGYIKQRVYATPPPTLQEFRNRITDACASVSPAMLYNVQREVQSHVQMCIVAEGHHFEHDR